MVQLQRQASPTVPSVPPTQTLKIQRPPFPKWYGTPPYKPIFLAQEENYKAKAYYSIISDWNRTILSTRHISVSISADMLQSLPRSISSMFLNDARFASNGISLLSHILSRLNLLSSKNLLLLTINDLNHIDMLLNETSIDYMYRV